MNGRWLLTILIVVALVAGAVTGQLLHDPEFNPVDVSCVHKHIQVLQTFDFIGTTVFMGLLKMLIIPLIASSIIVGVTSVGDFSKLGRMGIRTIVYYFATMVIAVVIGLIVVTAMKPGAEMTAAAQSLPDTMYQPDENVASTASGGLAGVTRNLVSQIIPTNIVAAMAEGQVLGVISFSIFFGVVVTLIGDKGTVIVAFFNAVFEVLMKMVHTIMWIAPLGVFALLAWSIARIGLGVFTSAIGKYMIAVVSGLLIHGLLVLPLVLLVFCKTNPYSFMSKMRQALMTALATDSSSATLPVTMDCATGAGQVSKKVAGFVLPLGSTINMDGTALYEAVAVVFMAQAFGIELTMAQLAIVAVTATLAAVGAASIPSAGLVTMVIVVDAVNSNLALSGQPIIPLAAIGLIIGVDRLLDMLRTTVNVWGDAVGAKIIDSLDTDQ